MNDAPGSRIAGDASLSGEPVDVDALIARFRDRSAKIGVIGLGYVGLPLVRTIAERGFSVLTHRLVPPNDGGLALGQTVVAAALAGERE